MPNIQQRVLHDGYQLTTTKYENGPTYVDSYKTVRLVDEVFRSYLARPGYHAAVRAGRRPGMNAMTYYHNRELWPNGVWQTKYGTVSSVSTGTLPLYQNNRNPISVESFTSKQRSDLDAQLRTEVRLAMKDQKVNFGVAAAEWQKTADMVTDAATSIYNAYRNMRRGNFAQAARDLGVTASKRGRRRFTRNYARNQQDAVADGWLELQYGWKPLLSDVYGAAEFAAKQSVPTVEAKVVQKRSIEVNSATPYKVVPYTELETRRARLEYKYTVYFRISGRLTSAAGQTGLLNPLAIAWELVPFSFVVDWFLPIGDVLNSLDATAGLSFVEGCVSSFEKATTERQRTGGNANDRESSSWSKEYLRFDRTVLSDFPAPALPRFKNPVSVDHALNAIALLNQLRK